MHVGYILTTLTDCHWRMTMPLMVYTLLYIRDDLTGGRSKETRFLTRRVNFLKPNLNRKVNRTHLGLHCDLFIYVIYSKRVKPCTA